MAALSLDSETILFYMLTIYLIIEKQKKHRLLEAM
jgi:hypothetical protein